MSVIDEYLVNLPEAQRKALEHVRELVKSEVPDATETIGYGIPTLKYKNKNLIHFAAFKDHLSIFPTVAPLDELADELKDYRKSKGTLQFTEDKPMPDELIIKLVCIQKNIIDNKSLRASSQKTL